MNADPLALANKAADGVHSRALNNPLEVAQRGEKHGKDNDACAKRRNDTEGFVEGVHARNAAYRPKLNDGGQRARRLQPERDAAVKCSRWLGGMLIVLESKLCPSELSK